ncbi:MAG: FecR domain-containing protein [Bacteroidales bacterium]|nr:FecR domain-containing protein [Bacteroidales bacterium]
MNNKPGHNIPVDLIARRLSGEASVKDLQALDNWLTENKVNRKIFDQYATLWEKTGDIKEIETIDLDKEWEKFSRSTATSKPAGRITGMPFVIRLAAAVFAGAIIALSGLLIHQNSQYEKLTAGAQVSEVILPDGSAVTMNAGSKIRYHKDFGDESRKLMLEGEAYFDVAKDSLKPFSVEAEDIIVKVLGTAFNVDATDSANRVTVIVAEGRVALYGKAGRELSAQLVKGEKAVVDTRTYIVDKDYNEDPNFDSYKTRNIVFNDTGLDQVAETLQKVYNVNIEIERSATFDKSITVTFNNKDLDYVLETIEATLDLNIEKTAKDIIIR